MRSLFALTLFGAGLLASTFAGIDWKTDAPQLPTRLDANARLEVLADLGQRETPRHIIVKLDQPADEALRASLAADGIELQSYLGDRSYFATLAPSVSNERVASAQHLVALSAIDMRHKLHRDLASQTIHPWTVIKESPSDPDKPTEGRPVTVAAIVLFHGDVELEGGALTAIRNAGGKPKSALRSLNGWVVHIPSDRIERLASDDRVMYVEPPLPGLTELNDSNRIMVEADTLQEPPYDLDGTGINVLVYDGGRMFQHGDFGSRLTVGASDTSGTSDHATHVGGTIGGDGAGSGGTNRGMAPNVTLTSFGFEQPGGLQQGFLYTDPGDIEADYTDAISTYGADLSNNSIGTNTAPNGYPCEWEGDYGATGALIDAIARGSLGAPFRIFWANGNERGSGRCGTTYLTTAPPACAKNHITVGALNSNDDSVTSFTSWGPTDDGRLKPDISAPGCQSGGDGGVTSTSSSGGYNVKCGTSMASPTAAGIGALMLQQYRQSFPGEPDPLNSTFKAILANSAVDVGNNVGPDYQTGYGSIRGVAAISNIQEGRFLEDEVSQGTTRSFIVIVEPGTPELKVTIAWDDAPGTPNVNPVLVNDLDLTVVDSGGTTYFPWTLDPANPGDPAVRTVRDGANNIEQVVIDNPAPGAYRVDVTGFNIAEGPTQSFSAAAAPSLINCSSQGIVAVSASRVQCEANIAVEVIDCDLNTDDATIETVTVNLTSPTEPGGESLLLTESAPEAAAFSNSIALSATDAAGTLQIVEGDIVEVSYLDADDGEGGTNILRTRQVTVDCSGPQILAVSTTDIGPRDATANIQTDEPVSVVVNYGLDCSSLNDSVSKGGLSTDNALQITSLQDSTTYYYNVQVTDEAGNSSSSDNGGICYSFTTPDIPNFFTEQFTSGFDVVDTVATFTTGGGIDFYSACIEPLGGVLPTDPAGGTDLSLADDTPGSFDLLNGETVSLYGVDYSTVHVGPNGYVTFGGGDSDYTETPGDHFDSPRISARFDDLNPSAGGTVSWRQLTDRVAITWEDVFEYQTTNPNTFQIELFFDGTIRMSWIELSGSDGIIGLSDGSGIDPDFFDTDISALGACGARPPIAYDGFHKLEPNQSLSIPLIATDDGLPNNTLILALESLPFAGTLVDDETGLNIVSVPHTFSTQTPSVTYTPAQDYVGPDGFLLSATDGGIPAEGGGKSDFASIVLDIANAYYEFLVDDSNPGWNGTGDWEFGIPTGGGTGNGDPTSGATGSNVLGYNLDGDYANNMAEETITSGAMDLSGASNVTVEFMRWLGVGAANRDHASFQVSTDGTNFTDVWVHTEAGGISDSAWQQQSFDVTALLANQPTAYLRWTMGTTDVALQAPGWNIDDITVSSGTTSSFDCDPGDPDIIRSPVEVVGMMVSGPAPSAISWNDQDLIAGPGTTYDLLSGTLSSGVAGLASPSCLQSAPVQIHVDARTDPTPGEAFWYLVRAGNNCGLSGLGNSTRDAAMADGNGNGITDVCE